MANTMYASVPEFRTYAAARGVSLMGDTGEELTDDEINVFLTKAQDYIDLVFTFKGEAVGDYSQFPRTGLEQYDETTVPPAVRTATMYVATHILDGLPILEGQKAQAEIKREVVASNRIETEYATSSKESSTLQGYAMLEAPMLILKRAGLLAHSIGAYNLWGVRG